MYMSYVLAPLIICNAKKCVILAHALPPVFVIWTTINGDGVAFRHHVTCELTLGRNLNQNEKNPLVYHRVYDIPLPERHRFPGSKYSLLSTLSRERV